MSANLCLSRNVQCIIIKNLWIKKGLTNGAMGTLRHIIFKEGDKPPSLPVAIIVEMEEKYGDGPCITMRGVKMPRYVAIPCQMSKTSTRKLRKDDFTY